MAAKEEHLLSVINKEKLKYAKQIKVFLIQKNEEKVKELLEKFTEDDKYILNMPLDEAGGWRLLHYAAANYLRGSVEALIAKGADPKRKNDEGNTCLQVLFTSKNYLDNTIKQTFLGKNANGELKKQEAEQRALIIELMPSTVINLINSQKKTALDLALEQGPIFIMEAKLLLNAKGKIASALSVLPEKESIENSKPKQKPKRTELPVKYIVPSESSNYSSSFFPKSTLLPASRERSNTVGSLPVSKSPQTQVQSRINLFDKKFAEQMSESYKKN